MAVPRFFVSRTLPNRLLHKSPLLKKKKKKNLSYTFNIDIKVIYCSFLRADYFIFQHFRKLILVKAIKNIISEKYCVTNREN